MASSSEDSKRKIAVSCAICGDEAFGRNFGAISCESCKSFYRRHINRPAFKCPSARNCSMNKLTRRYCPACRLQKCFDVGMRRPDADTNGDDEHPSTSDSSTPPKRSTISQDVKKNYDVFATEQAWFSSNFISNTGIKSNQYSATDDQFQDLFKDIFAGSLELAKDWFLYVETSNGLSSSDTSTRHSAFKVQLPEVPFVINYMESYVRLYVLVIKKICDFRSLDTKLQLLVLRKTLLSQISLLSAYCLNLELTGGISTDKETGEVAVILVSDCIKVFDLFGMKVDQCTEMVISLVRSIRSELIEDWPFVVLLLCVINLFSTPVDDEEGDAATSRSALHQRRVRSTDALRLYLDRRYGGDGTSSCKFEFCLRVLDVDLPAVFKVQLQNMITLFSMASTAGSNNLNHLSNFPISDSLSLEFVQQQMATHFAPLIFELMAVIAATDRKDA